MRTMLAILLAGCAGLSASIHDAPFSTRVRRGILGTQQQCTQREQLDKDVGRVWPILQKELRASGYSGKLELGNDPPPPLCLIVHPEPCTLSPCAAEDRAKRCIRRAGCSTGYGAWVALRWPPLCRSDWPTEGSPVYECVSSTSEQTDHHYFGTLIHELQSVVYHRGGNAPPPHTPVADRIVNRVHWRLQ